MIEARAEREQELTELIQSDRSKLVAIYITATGRKYAGERPSPLACAEMIREIIDIELPLDGA